MVSRSHMCHGSRSQLSLGSWGKGGKGHGKRRIVDWLTSWLRVFTGWNMCRTTPGQLFWGRTGMDSLRKPVHEVAQCEHTVSKLPTAPELRVPGGSCSRLQGLMIGTWASWISCVNPKFKRMQKIGMWMYIIYIYMWIYWIIIGLYWRGYLIGLLGRSEPPILAVKRS